MISRKMWLGMFIACTTLSAITLAFIIMYPNAILLLSMCALVLNGIVSYMKLRECRNRKCDGEDAVVIDAVQ